MVAGLNGLAQAVGKLPGGDAPADDIRGSGQLVGILVVQAGDYFRDLGGQAVLVEKLQKGRRGHHEAGRHWHAGGRHPAQSQALAAYDAALDVGCRIQIPYEVRGR